MNRKTSWLAVPSVAVAALLLVACGQPSDQKTAGEASPPPRTDQAQSPPPASPPPEEQPPVVSRAPSRERARATTPPREPVRRREAPEPPAAQPADMAPPPEPIVKTLAAGTAVDLIVLDGLSSQTSQAGDVFRARVAHDITHDGMVVIPAGSVVHGSVTEAVPLKKIGGTAKLVLHFSRIELTTGSSVTIESSIAEQGKSETKKDTATIGGAAAGGALLGRIVGKNTKGALIGAVVGAAAGTAIAAKTQGEQVEIPVGSEISIRLSRPIDVTVRP